MHILRNYYNQSFFILIMSGTTNILELPTEHRQDTNKEIPNQYVPDISSINAGQGQGVSLDETTINQIVNGLQRASATGITQLQSRDIPITTSGISNDPQIQPNYIPSPPQQSDYIKDYQDTSDIINNYNKNKQHHNSVDDMYSELQIPLLLAVLYFLFQLPFLRKILFAYVPILFSKDGNMNINGFLFNSVLFGLTFYVLNKSTELFSRF